MFNRCEDERRGKLNSPPQLEATQEDGPPNKRLAVIRDYAQLEELDGPLERGTFLLICGPTCQRGSF